MLSLNTIGNTFGARPLVDKCSAQMLVRSLHYLKTEVCLVNSFSKQLNLDQLSIKLSKVCSDLLSFVNSFCFILLCSMVVQSCKALRSSLSCPKPGS